MSRIDLLPNTWKYGYENCSKSTLITTILIVTFIFTTSLMVRLHSKFLKKNINGKKRFLKIVPILIIISFSFLMLWRFTTYGLGYEKVVWQADFFVAFLITLIVLITITPVYVATVTLQDGTKERKDRRKWIQYLVNGTFKISFFLFWAFLFTPYYVMLIGSKGIALNNLDSFISLIIYIVFCGICYFSFGRSPFAPLLPGLVLWGACSSYYTWETSIVYGIFFNLSGPVLMVAGVLFGFGFLNFLDPILKGNQAFWAMMYIFALGAVMFVGWPIIWDYYGYGQGGTGYNQFHTYSWYR